MNEVSWDWHDEDAVLAGCWALASIRRWRPSGEQPIDFTKANWIQRDEAHKDDTSPSHFPI